MLFDIDDEARSMATRNQYSIAILEAEVETLKTIICEKFNITKEEYNEYGNRTSDKNPDLATNIKKSTINYMLTFAEFTEEQKEWIKENAKEVYNDDEYAMILSHLDTVEQIKGLRNIFSREKDTDKNNKGGE